VRVVMFERRVFSFKKNVSHTDPHVSVRIARVTIPVPCGYVF
jgi:hypothetical protein